MLDYSQHGQALIIQQLLTADTPRILVDIGAHDGITNSNSRALVEQGWRAVLVEPLPMAFSRLRENCRNFAATMLLHSACSDRSGTAKMRIGIDGEMGQLSSMSESPAFASYLGTESFDIETITLEEVFRAGNVPADFGVLLVDTEGLDFRVLQCLKHTTQRPRIIVTEDFAETDALKYVLLSDVGYRFVGSWGSDSIWLSRSHAAVPPELRLPLWRLPSDWRPSGTPEAGAVRFEAIARQCVVGWAFGDTGAVPTLEVVVDLRPVNSPQRYVFRAARNSRMDVAEYYQSPRLWMSGFRACIDVPPGEYELRVIQQEASSYSESVPQRVSIP